MIERGRITGLVLAGGRGSRMGGVDKGLQVLRGKPLAQHAIERLRPQVGPLWANANRHAEAYAAFGVPVCADTVVGQPGPLAGLLAGLAACTTPWLAAVPCDVPRFPAYLVARLAEGLLAMPGEAAELAIAVTLESGQRRRHPVFCLLSAALRDDLAAALARDERRVQQWMGRHRCAEVVFDDPAAFVNANTEADLRLLETDDDA
jgi:molybdopterin-guanine dinucleotide biosynthesis protein A